MRCYCCQKVLTTQEATRKFVLSGTFTEMCNTCLATIDVLADDGVVSGEDDDDDFDVIEE